MEASPNLGGGADEHGGQVGVHRGGIGGFALLPRACLRDGLRIVRVAGHGAEDVRPQLRLVGRVARTRLEAERCHLLAEEAVHPGAEAHRRLLVARGLQQVLDAGQVVHHDLMDERLIVAMGHGAENVEIGGDRLAAVAHQRPLVAQQPLPLGSGQAVEMRQQPFEQHRILQEPVEADLLGVGVAPEQIAGNAQGDGRAALEEESAGLMDAGAIFVADDQRHLPDLVTLRGLGPREEASLAHAQVGLGAGAHEPHLDERVAGLQHPALHHLPNRQV